MIEPVAANDFTTHSARRHPSQFESVKFRIDKDVARMTLNRPDHNLLNESMLREIADGILFAGSSEEVKLVVLDSACKVFSGGIDIGEYTRSASSRCSKPSTPSSPACSKSASRSSAS